MFPPDRPSSLGSCTEDAKCRRRINSNNVTNRQLLQLECKFKKKSFVELHCAVCMKAK